MIDGSHKRTTNKWDPKILITTTWTLVIRVGKKLLIGKNPKEAKNNWTPRGSYTVVYQ